MRTLRRVLLALLATLVIPIAVTTTAHADSFRFWGYYQWTDDAWTFATTGPADAVPVDGDTEGWRFAVADETSTRFPRVGDVFDDICGEVSPADGQKRVAVVLDYGTAEDAPEGTEPPPPRGDCAQVPTDASGADVLAAVAEVRSDPSGLTCGIDGYPATGCGDPVAGPAPTTSDEPVDLALAAGNEPTADEPATDTTTESPAAETEADDSNATLWLVLGIVGIVAVAIGAAVRMRRSPEE